MATSKLQSIFSNTFLLNGYSVKIGPIHFQFGNEQSIPSSTQTTYNFPTSFNTTNSVLIPICSQLGFGARSCLSITNKDNSSCYVYQWNTQSASMKIRVLAIGY